MKRKGNYGKKVIAFSALVAMIATSVMDFPAVSAAKENNELQVRIEKADTTYRKTAFDRMRERIAANKPAKYKADQIVEIIVELKNESLLDKYTRSIAKVEAGKTKTFQQYLNSRTVQSSITKMQEAQNQTLAKIEKAVDDVDDLEVRYQYSTAMNGFAIRTKYSELETIKKLSNVKAAYVSPKFKRPKPAVKKYLSSSKGMIGMSESWELQGYHGEGQVVAIVDTGLDTMHEAFQTAPQNPKYDEKAVRSIIYDKMLNADIKRNTKFYVNDKVPFAFDYADWDNDVIPSEEGVANGNDHGTHVAGIVAGVSDKITGVAKEAQLMIFKVFPDEDEDANMSDIIAALEDSVRLGVDVINMSLGASNGFTDGSENEVSLSQVYERIVDAGISMSVAAGNEGSISVNNGMDSTALTSNPDTSVISSPSTYQCATSVASVVNNAMHVPDSALGEDGKVETGEGSRMSDFSSWGVSPNLDLKPEIAAPGEHIYSSVPSNQYDDMSGTSMAAPHVAGTYALVKQYIRDKFKDLTNEEIGKLATQLLMSTAHPTSNEDNIFYAPRQQGSGIVNIYDATRTKAYLYTDSDVEINNKPKLNLYDDPARTGVFEKSFHIKNISEQDVTYTVVNTTVAETVEKGMKGESILGEKPQDMSDKVAYEVRVDDNVCEDNKVTVGAGEDVLVTVKWTMNDEFKGYFNKNFENGEFFEGFLQLENGLAEDADLSIAYLGFYGDWTQAPLFDSGSIYNGKDYQQAPHGAVGDSLYLGINYFDENLSELIDGRISPYMYPDEYADVLMPDASKIAINPESAEGHKRLEYIELGMLRNAKELSYVIKDNKGNIVKEGSSQYVGRSSDSGEYVEGSVLDVDFCGTDEEQNKLPNNCTCTVKVTGKLDYDKHVSKNKRDTFSFPVTIDTEDPEVGNVKLTREGKKVYLSLNACDNQYLQYVDVCVVGEDDDTILAEKMLNEKKKRTITSLKVDVTEEIEKYGTAAQFYIEAVDYAMNETVMDLYLKGNLKLPAPLTGLKESTATTSSITLAWNKYAGATGYSVKAYNAAKKAYVTVKDTKSTALKVSAISKKKLAAGTVYKFKVDAYKTASGKKTVLTTAYISAATRPATPVITVKPGKKKASLFWKKVNGADGYVVSMSTKRTSGFKNVATITGKTTYTKTRLTSKKTYYFKVNAYKKVNGKAVYSSGSIVKSVKAK